MIAIGMAAPPVGALEIVLRPFLLRLTDGNADQLWMVGFLPMALVVSYVLAVQVIAAVSADGGRP